MLDNHIRVLPITSSEDLQDVYDAAASDEDGVLNPTHMVLKNGEIVGAISIQVFCGSWWMHSKKTKGRESLTVFQVMDSLLADRKIFKYLIPCKDTSPYYKLMEKIGFRKILGNWGLFIKE